MGRLDDKVCLITGAARGMGHTTAELFAKEGATVIGADVRDPEPHEAEVEAVSLDVSSEDAWKEVVAGIVAKHGRLDVLVNNAGVIAYEPILELDLENWHRLIAADQTGVFLGMRESLPAMIDSGGGSIVNVSSIWGGVAVPGAHAYHAAKAAVLNMSRNVALTHVGDGVRCNAILPGYIKTPLTDVQAPEVNQSMVDTTPMHRGGEPIEVAYGSLYLASDESSFVTGTELVIDGGLMAQ
ncbi:MAG: oxidoreductase [Solirubrobacterales bacterium 70-9]|nr:MAG: oxidoreductase [Solirubrobacterales bacterium 70-9]